MTVFGGGVSKEVPKVNELIKPRTQDTQDRDLCKKGRPGHRHTEGRPQEEEAAVCAPRERGSQEDPQHAPTWVWGPASRDWRRWTSAVEAPICDACYSGLSKLIPQPRSEHTSLLVARLAGSGRGVWNRLSEALVTS